MTSLLIVGEDELCCALGTRIVGDATPGWQVHGQPLCKGGITKLLPELPRYAQQARHVRPVLCIADTDGRCPVRMLAEHLPAGRPPGLLVRLAIPEAECWVLADRAAVAAYFQISPQAVPSAPEQLADAKQEVLRLAKKSKLRQIREEMVAGVSPLKQGAGYNLHMRSLVSTHWRAARAADHSPSLQKTIERLRAFAAQQA